MVWVYEWLFDPEAWYSWIRVFRFITARTAYAAITSLVLCWFLGRWFIPILRRYKLTLREHREYLDFHDHKEGTPSMGGILIVVTMFLSIILWADLDNRFVLMSLIVLVTMGLLGAVDDWLQMGTKNGGLRAITKVLVQGGVAGLIAGWLVYDPLSIRLLWIDETVRPDLSFSLFFPFFRDFWIPLGSGLYAVLIILVIVGCSNAVNLTDGLDGLATGCVVFAAVTYGAFSYVSGHFVFSEYLQVPNVIGAAELTVVMASMVGACLGFLWYNAYPAEVFMGDAGSLPLGAVVGTSSVLIKQELLLVIVGGIFVAEAVSVMLQYVWYKFTGDRFFRMAPFHHHFELEGVQESKITIRFWIVAILLALVSLSTLKLR